MLIFGNAGSGKSTLAKQLAARFNLLHLDLDTVAWQNTQPPTRKSLDESVQQINLFIGQHSQWVVEGGYTDLLSQLVGQANEMFFLNPSIEVCINHCKKRAWEPHKYKSMQDQDDNLNMLIEWLQQYPKRDDAFSLLSHKKLFIEFSGMKTEYNSDKR